jgi:hypothetical protein
MAGPTMAELITQVRRRADLENSAFVTDQELEDFLNDSIAELHSELLSRWGDEYFATEEQIAVAGGPVDEDGSEVSLSPPFDDPPLKVLGVALFLEAEQRLVPLHTFSFGDTVQRLDAGDWANSPPRYKLKGNDVLAFDQPPSVTQQIIVRAVEQATRYDKDVASEIDELYAWREFVIVDTTIKVMQKEESDTAALDARKQYLLVRMSANAPPRDIAAPKMIRDDRALQGGENWEW